MRRIKRRIFLKHGAIGLLAIGLPPRFLIHFGQLCGAKGIRVASIDELDDALAVALAYDGPALVDVVADAALI